MKKKHIFGAVMLIAGITASLVISTGQEATAEKPKECICLDVYDPVCIIETGQRFSNGCYAQCAGFTPDEFGPCDLD